MKSVREQLYMDWIPSLLFVSLSNSRS